MKAGVSKEAIKTRLLVVFMVLVAGLPHRAAGQGQSQGCPSTFFAALAELMPCRSAVAPFSPTPPSDACCAAIKALGQPCLCVLMNGPAIAGIDRYMALQLPAKCTANFPPCVA